MILDSNIIIYAARPDHVALRNFISREAHSVSAISWVECFGYSRITEEEERRLRIFFDRANILDVSMEVISIAADLRRLYRIDLGDSIIAATSMLHKLTLATHNIADFKNIEGLALHDPLTEMHL